MPIVADEHRWQAGAGENLTGGDAPDAGYVEVEAGGILNLGAVTIGGGFVINPNSPGSVNASNYNVNENALYALSGGIINVSSLQIGGDFFGTGSVSGGTLNVTGNVVLHGMDTGDGPLGGSLFAVPAGLDENNNLAVGEIPWVGIVPQFNSNTTSPAILQVGVAAPVLLGGLSPTAANGVTSTATIGGTLTVGDDSQGGVLMVDGVGSTLTAGATTVAVGTNSVGEIDDFSQGALTINGDLNLAIYGGSIGKLTVDNATFTVHGGFFTGYPADNNTPNGGTSFSNTTYFRNGARASIDGAVVVQGQNAQFTIAGSGTLLSVAGLFTIGSPLNDPPMLTVSGNGAEVLVTNGANLDLTGQLNFSQTPTNGGLVVTNDTQLDVESGATVRAGKITVQNSGTVDNALGTVIVTTLDNQGSYLGPIRVTGTTTNGATGTITGSGVVNDVFNNGVMSAGVDETLTIDGAISGSGLFKINESADPDSNIHMGTLDLSQAGSNAQTVASFEDDGILILGTTNLHVTGSYNNMFWGSGNSFNAHANVTGTGQIIGDGAALGITGADVTQGANGPTLNLHAIGGGLEQGSFTLDNDGSGATVTAALQTLGLGSGFSGIAAGNVTLASGQASTYTLTFDPTAGTLAGRSLTVVSDFDNIAPITIRLSGAIAGTGAHSDFNGDGTSDILFRDDGNGDTGFYQINNGTNVGWHDVGASSTAYSIVGTGDFTGSGTDDILYRDAANGDTGFYQINNGANIGWQDIGASSTAYSVAGVGDFTGNGTDDILFRDNAGGDTGFYAMNNGVNTGWVDVGASSTAYSVVGVGDFTGNGTDDILFRNNANGDTGFYEISNGINTGWHDLGASSTAYSVVGVGDFLGNGTDDILFRDNATGDTGFYAINNGVNTGWHDVGASSTAYAVVGTGDYLGNGTDDILFRNDTTGDTGFYQIVNGANSGWVAVGASSIAYHVAS